MRTAGTDGRAELALAIAASERRAALWRQDAEAAAAAGDEIARTRNSARAETEARTAQQLRQRLAAAEHRVRQWRHLSQQLHQIAESGTHESETVEAAQQLLDEVDPAFVNVAAECVAAQILLMAAERALSEAQEA